MPNGQYEFVHNNYDNETRLKFEALKVSVSSTLTEFLSNVNIQPGRTSKKMSKNLNTFIKVVKDAPDLNTFKDYIRDIKILLDNFGINKTNKSFQKGMKFLHNYIDFTRLSDAVGADTMIGKAISTGAKVVQGTIGIYNNYLEKAKAEIDQAFQEVEELQKDLYDYSQNKINENKSKLKTNLSFNDKDVNLLKDESSELSDEPDVNDKIPHPPNEPRTEKNSPRFTAVTPPTTAKSNTNSPRKYNNEKKPLKIANEQTNEKPLTKVNEQENEKPLRKAMARPENLPKSARQRPLPTKKDNR